jgi:hypothetical protein
VLEIKQIKHMAKRQYGLCVVLYTCNPRTWEAEAGGLKVQVQSGLHRDPVSKIKIKQNQPDEITKISKWSK